MDRLMFATRLSALLVALHVVGMTTAMAQTVRVAVKNPSAVARPGEPVVIRWNILRHHVSALPRSVIVKDARGKLYENQVDDLDIDGVPDELTFVADFGAREEKVFAIRASPRAKSKSARMRTDAADWKRIDGVLRAIDDDDVPGAKRVRGDYRFDGVGWESELTAYRLYLDDRNAVDILGKRKPGLYWNYIGTSGVDYQMDADWGMDVLHVGSALGIGGIGFWVGDSVLKPLSVDAQRTRILARGPVRTVVSVDYTGWDKGRGKVDLKSTFFQYAGERACEHRVTLKSSGPPDTIVAGIVRHDSTSTTWDPAQGSPPAALRARRQAGAHARMTAAAQPVLRPGRTR